MKLSELTEQEYDTIYTKWLNTEDKEDEIEK